MQRFLDPYGLQSRGIDHFDAWAATFAEVVDTMEISPDGAGLRPRSRFARFTNLPELQQMFRQFADVQTAEMLNLPRPRLRGGKPIVVACPMSEEQHQLQQELVERYERLRSQKVDPRVDNALAITTDGRKLATDARMLSPTAPDFPESKVNRLVENVFSTWKETAAKRGTQMVFAESQLRDYRERLGKPFPHEKYLSELTDLRDQLKAGLSAAAHEAGSDKGPRVSELADRIKALKAANTIEAAPQRVQRKQAAAEEPITARIRRRQEADTEISEAVPPGRPSAAEAANDNHHADNDNQPRNGSVTPLTFQERIALERQRQEQGPSLP
jgi:hypothetical protein